MTSTAPEETIEVHFMRLNDGPVVPVTDEAFRLVWEPRGYAAVSDQEASDVQNAPNGAAPAVDEKAAPPAPPAGQQRQTPLAGNTVGSTPPTP